jgi:hypothetical protein
MDALSQQQISAFIREGFIKIENAFSKALADECRNILWKATGCDPDNRNTWKEPVIRIGEMSGEPFAKAANTAVLHSAFDQLAGKDNWLPRQSLGSFPIRFPNKIQAADTGWHVDASYPGDEPDNYLKWRININSKGRALLMLFLFSDVSEQDAPTVIKVGSHFDIAKMLEPAGEKGLSFMEVAERLGSLPERSEVLATGRPGTVYLCHPFIVHAAQDHRGSNPKFMAQPPLPAKKDFNIKRPESERCAVETAIAHALRN